MFSNFISFLNFNKKEDFYGLYDLINLNYRELNEENFKKFLEGKLEDKKTKEMFEFVQAIVKYYPILNTGNNVYCDNCNSILPQELLARDISDNEYDMQFYRTVINKSAILRILKSLERADTILFIVTKIAKDEIEHAMSITKTCKSRYIFSDINKSNVLEFSSEEEVCDIIELASNKYCKDLNCFPGIEFINSTKTVKKVIEHYALKHKMYESENMPNNISLTDDIKTSKLQNEASNGLEAMLKNFEGIQTKLHSEKLMQEQELSNTQQNLTEKTKELTGTRTQLEKLQKELNEKTQALESTKTQLAEKEEELKGVQVQLEQEKTKLQDELKKKEKELNSKIREVTELTEEKSQLEKKQNSIQQDLVEKTKALNSTQAQLEKLQKDSDAKTKEFEGTKAQLEREQDSVKQELDKTTEELKRKEADLKNGKKELDNVNKKVSKLEHETLNQQASINDLTEERDQLASETNTLTEKLESKSKKREC